MTTIGIIGAGHIGSQLARLSVAHGHNVVIANSRGPETLSELVAELGPLATAGTAEEAATAAEIAIVTVPLAAIETIPVEPLAGKTVIDTNNYYFERDGRIAELEDKSTTVSELLQKRLPTSHVVKSFNHITAADLTTEGSPSGTPGRRALVAIGSDPDAVAQLVALLDEFGFDAVQRTPLSEGWRIERDKPGYGSVDTAAELSAHLDEAQR